MGDEVLYGILSYLGILVLIPYFTQKNNSAVMFHAKQGMVLLISWVVLFMVSIIIGFIPVIGLIWALFSWVLYVIIGIISIIGIINVVQGQQKYVPIFGKFSEKINF